MEVLRREGFELSVGPPKAVLLPDPNCSGGRPSFLEPIEECTVLVKEEYAGGVVQKLVKRRGELRSYDTGEPEEGWVRIVMDIPARGLIGYMAGEFKNDVHGQGYIASELSISSALLDHVHSLERLTISSKHMSPIKAVSILVEMVPSSR